MIDLHCHVLPGIDDGPDDDAESLALVRAAGAAGARTLVATPHVSARYPNEAAAIERLVAEQAARMRADPVARDVQLRVGAEVALTRVAELQDGELGRLGLGGGSWLLLEPPLAVVAAGLELVVSDLQRRGHGIVLAHPERCPAFHRSPDLLRALVRRGALTSVTAGSFTGRFGATVRRFAYALAEADLVHNVASDFHDLHRRPPGIADALAAAGLGPLAEWLTCDVPAAILADAAIPPRPVTHRHAGAGRRLSRWWRIGPFRRAS